MVNNKDIAALECNLDYLVSNLYTSEQQIANYTEARNINHARNSLTNSITRSMKRSQ